MRITTFGALCISLSLFSATSAATQAHRHILEASGIASILPILPEEISASANRNAQRCESKLKTVRQQPVSVVLASVQEKMATATSAAQAQNVSDWYRTDLAKKITRLEQQPIDEIDFDHFVRELTNRQKPQSDRLALINQIYENTGAGELEAIISLEIEYAGLIQSGCIEKMESQNDEDATSNLEQVKADIMRDDKLMMMNLFKADAIFGIAYTLRSLDNAELADYTSFTTANKDFYQVLVSSIETALKEFSSQMFSGD